jgi:hypothetical protein
MERSRTKSVTSANSPLKNSNSRSSRGNEAHFSSRTNVSLEPPRVGCYFLNRLLAPHPNRRLGCTVGLHRIGKRRPAS